MSYPVEEIVPESSAKGSVDHPDYSSSSSTDGDDFRQPANDKSHLFGRQKPVHAALGGGKLPWFYEKHEDQVDTYAQKAKKELKRQYSHLDEKVLQKLRKVPFVKDSEYWGTVSISDEEHGGVIMISLILLQEQELNGLANIDT
ncbi:hypothetical protein K7X08_011837 [Anisodus acutangulus]|uniref:Uncharacterized protein n=1 Tax=Anisodus acutangulus TaxID=402998 RepID=A0A9Q1MKT1_9SOLA|nr:hypothetical protein K7X08_011837 [Anisodus acutangulus]